MPNNEFGMGFDSDFYKELIQRDEHKDDIPIIEAEEIPGIGPIVNGLDILKSMKDISNVKDSDANNELKKMSDVFNSLFEGLNQKYGLNIHYDCESFADSLKSIIDPTNMKAMSLYLSEGYERFRLILYQQYLVTIAMISKQIFDPSYILSESLTFADKMIVIEKLMMFMKQMNEIYAEVKVEHTERILENMSDNKTNTYNLDDPKIKDILEAVAKRTNIEPDKSKES